MEMRINMVTIMKAMLVDLPDSKRVACVGEVRIRLTCVISSWFSSMNSYTYISFRAWMC